MGPHNSRSSWTWAFRYSLYRSMLGEGFLVFPPGLPNG